MSHWRKLRRATVTNPGESYEEKPTVTVSEPTAPKQPAQGLSELDNGSVSNINLDSGGNFYSTTPNVTLSAPDSGGTQATATAIINNGEVTKISVLDSGSGYSSPPQVIVPKSTDPKSDFAAQLTLDFDSATGTVTAINVVDSGNFFDEDNPPAITISPPFGNRDFEIGEDVTISGIDADSTAATVTGEVAQWVESSGKLTVIHIANDTGDLVEPTANSIVTAVESGASSKVTKVETPAIPGDISDEFDDQASDFLDFSESNPFGEPEAATVAQEAAAAIVTAQSTPTEVIILGNKSQPSFVFPLEFKVTANGVDYQFNAANNDTKNFFMGLAGLNIPGFQVASYLKLPIVNGVSVRYEPQADGDTIKLAGSGWTHVGILEGEYTIDGDRQDLQAGDSATPQGPPPPITDIILQGNKADPSFATNKTYTLTADDITYTYGPTTNANRNFYQGLRDLNVPGLDVGTYSDSSITFGVQLQYTPQDSSDTLTLQDVNGWPHVGLAIGEYLVGINTPAPPPPAQGFMSDSDYSTAISQSSTGMVWDSAPISIGTSTIRYEEKFSFTGNTNVSGIPRQVVFGDNGRKIFFVSGGAYSNTALLYGMNLQRGYDISSIDSATSAGILDMNSLFKNILDSASYSGQYDDYNMLDVFFNPDGTKMWVTGNSWDTIIQFALDSAWNPFGIRTVEHKIGTGYMGAYQTGTLINGWVYDSNLEVGNWYSHEWVDSGRALVSSSLSDNGMTIKQEFSTPYDISTVTTSFTASSIGDNPHTLYSDSDSDGKPYAQDALKLAFSAGGKFNHDGTERYFIHKQFDDSAFDAGNNGLNGWRVNLVKATLDTPYDITTMSFASQTEITNLPDSAGAPTTAIPSGALTFHPDGSRFYWMSTGSNASGTPNYSDWAIYEFSGTGDSAGSSLITTPDITVAPMIQGTYVLDSAGTGQQQQTSTQDSARLSADSAVSGNSIFQGVTGDGITVGGNHPALLYPDSNIRLSTPYTADLEYRYNTDSPQGLGFDTSWVAGNRRGWSVAISKDLIITGIPNSRREHPGGISRGQGGYAINLNNEHNTLIQQYINGHIMEPAPDMPDGTAVTDATNEDEWGLTVAASGKTFAVGSPHYDNGASGSGYTGVSYGGVWVKSMIGQDSAGAAGYQLYNSNEFHEETSYTLMAPSPTTNGYFGSTIAMDSDFDRLVIGEYGRSSRQGRVYSYKLTTGELLGTIDNPYAANVHEFGRRIALSGDYLAVADFEYEDSDTTYTKDGAVHLFNLNDNSYLRSFHGDPSFKTNQRFGNEIAMEGTNLSVLDGEGQWYVFNIVSGDKIAGPIIDPRMDSLGDTVYTTEGNVSPEFHTVRMSGNIAALLSKDGHQYEQDPMGVDSNGEMVKRIYFYDVNNLYNNDSTPISYITRPSSPTYDIQWGNAEYNGNSYSKTGQGFDFYGHRTVVGAPYHSQAYTVSNYRKTNVGEVYVYGEIADSAGAADFRPGYEAWRSAGDKPRDFSYTPKSYVASVPPDGTPTIRPVENIRFKPDGTLLYALDLRSAIAFNLSTPWDLSTATIDSSRSYSNHNSATYDEPFYSKAEGKSLDFNNDGTQVVMSYNDAAGPQLKAWNLDSAYNLNSVPDAGTSNAGADITRTFSGGQNTGNGYGLNDIWDATKEDSSWGSAFTSLGFDHRVRWIDQGNKFVWYNVNSGGVGGRMIVFNTTTAYDVNSIDISNSGALSCYDFGYEIQNNIDPTRYGGGSTFWSDFWFSDDGTKIWVGARIPYSDGYDTITANDIFMFETSVAWDISKSNMTHVKTRRLGEDASSPDWKLTDRINSFFVKESEEKLWIGLKELYPAAADSDVLSSSHGIAEFSYDNTSTSAAAAAQPAPKASVERFVYDSTQEFTYDSTVEPIYGLELSPDGKTIVMKDAGINDWRAYSMTTAWDLTTASRDTSKEPTLTMDSSSHKMKEFGMTFNDDWTKLYTTRLGGSLDIYKNEISQYDISGGASTYSIDRIDDALDSNREDFWGTLGFFATVQDQTGFNRSQRPDNIQFGDSGRRLYWTSVAASPPIISQWHLSAPYTIDLDMYDSGALYYPAITNNEFYTNHLGMHVNYDGTRLYMLANSSVVDSAMHPGAPDRGIGIYQFDLADSWDITSATWDSSKFLQIENIPHGNVTDVTGDIFSTKDYLYTALTIDGTTKLRRYSIEDSVPPPPRSGSDSDGNGYATSLNWTVTVDIGPLYEDSATEGNVFYLEGDNSNFNY